MAGQIPCMRILLIWPLVLASAPALGADWTTYDNVRYGYQIAVPPALFGRGEPDAHDGQVFHSNSGPQDLTVWGGFLLDKDFEGDTKRRMAALEAEGWHISYMATTPRWASYSAVRGSKVVYARAISGCGGNQYAAFNFEYPRSAIAQAKPVVERLVASLRQVNCP
jgi:hypothetical protein